MIRLLALALAFLLASATPAAAGPVIPVLVAIGQAVVGIGSVAGLSVLGIPAAFIVAGVRLGLTMLITRLTAPSMKTPNQERQASVMSLTLGEAAREAIFGESATGGHLLDAFNFGGTNQTDWEVQVIKVADHRCHSLVGYYIGDTFYAYSADGVQAGFNNQLEVYWYDGAPGQAASSYLLTHSASRLYGTPWESTDVVTGAAYVVFAYKADAPNATSPVWPQGRPAFKPQVKGKLCYDPRKDSTVTGGSGSHRWADPSTWEWTDNLYVCRYNYVRGIYAQDQVSDPTQLLIGRGLSADEADPVRVFAPANLCDEPVALKAGGTEPRYRANGVIKADEPFITVEEYFAAAAAGVIVTRDGGVEIEPGASKSAVAAITDGDLVLGEAVHAEDFLSENDRVNTVTPRYIAPDQLWQDHAAPVRHSTADLIDDGGLREKTLSLSLVTSQTQAQRCGEIERRLGRKELRYSIVLGPRFSWLEDGDWITWTSARYFDGATVTFRIESCIIGEDDRASLTLRQISASCYAWNPAVDEGTPGAAPIDEAGSLTGVALTGVAIVSFDLLGTDGSIIPAVQATWDTPVDDAISGVRLEVRRAGDTAVSPTTTHEPNLGEMIATNGVPSMVDLQGRLVPITYAGRRATPSGWIDITSGQLTIEGVESAFADGDLTPGEKLYVVPFIKAMIASRAALRARADALDLLESNNLERLAYETAADALDGLLATLSDPVAWDNSSDLTHIPDPAAVRAALEGAQTTERNLQTQIDAVYGTRIEDVAASVDALAGQISDGVLTVQEKLHTFIWTIRLLTFAQAALRDNADAFKLTAALGDAERIAFETADSNLDAALAGLTTPVAWNNTTDVTLIADPAGLSAKIEALATAEKALQAKINALNGTSIVDTGTGALLTSADVSNALWKLPGVNLFRKNDWTAFGSAAASTASPGFGRAGWGYTLGNIGSGFNGVKDTRGGYGLTVDPYSPSFHAKLTTGSGTATIRAGWRDAGGAALSDVADLVFTVTTADQRFVMPNIHSSDADFPTAHFQVFALAGDIASGKVVTVTDLMMEHANSATLDWRPSPDDPDLLRYATYVGTLDADKTSANTAAAISGQGSLATANSANWSSQVAGSGKPQDSADVTSSHTAAAISGQGSLATANGNYGSSDPGGPNGSFWGDTSTHTLKYRVGGSWVVIATNVGGISATASPTSVAGSHFGAATISTGFTTVTASGGSSYTYQWVFLDGDTCTIGSPHSASTNFSRFCNLGDAFGGTARCYVTSSDGSVAYADVVWSVSETH